MRWVVNKELTPPGKGKKKAQYGWLRAVLTPGDKEVLCHWSLPKRCVSRAVDRNRLKRWGRENLKAIEIKGRLLVIFLPAKEKGFYKNLGRKDFDSVFYKVLGELEESF